MAVTVNDIIQIKGGKMETFICETPKEAKSGQSTTSYVKKFCRDQMPSDVVDYKTQIKDNVLIVQAIKG